jgi:hypothetical protein
MSWLARLKNLQTPEGHATKPTEPGFVAPHPGVVENSGTEEVLLRLRQVGPANVAAITDHAVVVARACADCQHLGPRGTCLEPVAAGLRTEQEGFGIALPEQGQASGCAVFLSKAPELVQVRPHKVTPEQLHAAHAAHAEPWSEAVIARFQARAASVQRHGHGEQDAEDLAERLHLRDVDGDDRVLCVECSHYRRDRCGNYRAAGLMPPDLARVTTVMLQRCPGFAGAAR